MAEEVPPHKEAEEDTMKQNEQDQPLGPAQLKKLLQGTKCCCLEDYCRFYPKELLIKSMQPTWKRFGVLSRKKKCPYIRKEEHGQRCASKDRNGPKTSHA